MQNQTNPFGEKLHLLRPSWGIPEVTWRSLGRSWVPLGASWEPLGRVLGASWGDLEASWGGLGASWGALGASWAPLGPKIQKTFKTILLLDLNLGAKIDEKSEKKRC